MGIEHSNFYRSSETTSGVVIALESFITSVPLLVARMEPQVEEWTTEIFLSFKENGSFWNSKLI